MLTITNELLYDGLARQTFASRPRFLAPDLNVEASEMAMELGKANALLDHSFKWFAIMRSYKCRQIHMNLAYYIHSNTLPRCSKMDMRYIQLCHTCIVVRSHGSYLRQMLAYEIAKRLSSEVVVAQAGCLVPRMPVASANWLHGLTRTPQRQDAQLEISWPQCRRALEVLQVPEAAQDEVPSES